MPLEREHEHSHNDDEEELVQHWWRFLFGTRKLVRAMVSKDGCCRVKCCCCVPLGFLLLLPIVLCLDIVMDVLGIALMPLCLLLCTPFAMCDSKHRWPAYVEEYGCFWAYFRFAWCEQAWVISHLPYQPRACCDCMLDTALA